MFRYLRVGALGTVSKADMQAVEDAIRVHLGLAK